MTSLPWLGTTLVHDLGVLQVRRDPGGRDFVVLTAAGQADPAVVNRFAALVRSAWIAPRPGWPRILGSDLMAEQAWALCDGPSLALAEEIGGIEARRYLLRAAVTAIAGYRNRIAGPAPIRTVVRPVVSGSRPRRRHRALAMLVILALVLTCVGGAVLRGLASQPDEVSTSTVAAPSQEVSGPFLGLLGPSQRPTLSTREPVAVVGPVFTSADSTVVRDDLGLSFAFRLPPGWVCVPAETDGRDGVRRVCVNGDATTFDSQLRIIVRECRDGCGESARKNLLRDGWPRSWAPASPEWTLAGQHTSFVERVQNGRYGLWAAHLVPLGGTWMWLGISIDGPTNESAVLQKIVNDIRTQA